jgi:hypothetical protein
VIEGAAVVAVEGSIVAPVLENFYTIHQQVPFHEF